ncbi:MAG: dephospho-CoA kinase [Phycisphaerales bacterium]|nr:dephospho-CoA kinase [Phycisphaerales bacterium]
MSDANPPSEADPPLLDLRPSWLFIILKRLGWLLTCAALGTLGIIMFLGGPLSSTGAWLAVLALAVALLILLFSRLELDNEHYQLTPTHASWQSGVFRRLVVEAPLDRIQHAMLYRSIRERAFGLGTIGLATAGSDSVEIVWRMIENPDRALAAVKAAVPAPRAEKNPTGHQPDPSIAPMNAPSLMPVNPIPIIGLAGGIGSGKSEAGRILTSLGCLVIDSDRRARAALDRPDVRTRLVEWWGDGVLASGGTIDRSRVAAIVFSDPAQRARLESLVHPIVRQDRAAMIAEAGASARPPRAIVIDAPLLFETGLDRECDATLFIDAPEPVRLARVLETRGWSESELRRREAAQIPLAEKAARSTHRIDNAGDRERLSRQLEAALAEVLARARTA